MSRTKIPPERWDKAVEHAKKMLEIYKEIGPAGMFGAITITQSISLYENGDRSMTLLEDLENIK